MAKSKKHRMATGAYIGARSKGISWQMAYRFENRQKVLTLGQYPAVSLAEARRKCLEAWQVLASGCDPGEVRKPEKQASLHAEKEKALTLEVVAEQWFERQYSASPPATAKKNPLTPELPLSAHGEQALFEP